MHRHGVRRLEPGDLRRRPLDGGDATRRRRRRARRDGRRARRCHRCWCRCGRRCGWRAPRRRPPGGRAGPAPSARTVRFHSATPNGPRRWAHSTRTVPDVGQRRSCVAGRGGIPRDGRGRRARPRAPAAAPRRADVGQPVGAGVEQVEHIVGAALAHQRRRARRSATRPPCGTDARGAPRPAASPSTARCHRARRRPRRSRAGRGRRPAPGRAAAGIASSRRAIIGSGTIDVSSITTTSTGRGWAASWRKRVREPGRQPSSRCSVTASSAGRGPPPRRAARCRLGGRRADRRGRRAAALPVGAARPMRASVRR